MADVVIRQLTKSFGAVQVIRGVDLAVADGEFVVIVGPSGCGKSTLLRLIAGLEDATAGDIVIGGVRANTLPPARRGVAMVFQTYALYPHMSVYENMAFGLSRGRMSSSEIDARVRRAASTLELDALLERRPKELSGGQRQRVAIGRAIVREPGLFLFDEPLSNLDAALRVQMRIEISRLHQALGATMLYVTHDQAEAMTLADRIVLMNEGRVEQVGAPLELYDRPRNVFVAGFMGSPRMNFLACTVCGRDADGAVVALAAGGELRVPVDASPIAAGEPATLGVRPEHLVPVSAGEGVLSGRIEVLERLGDETLAYVAAEDANEGLVGVRLSPEQALSKGERLHLALRPRRAHLFDARGEALVSLDEATSV